MSHGWGGFGVGAKQLPDLRLLALTIRQERLGLKCELRGAASKVLVRLCEALHYACVSVFRHSPRAHS